MLRGIGLQLLAVAGFSTMGILIKMLDSRYPTSEVLLFRCLPALVPLLLWLPAQGGFAALKARQPGWHLVRTGAGIASMYVGFHALANMAYAEYVAISFTAPLFGTLLSVLILGDKIGVRRLGAVAIGFVGAVVTLGPADVLGAGEVNVYALFALGSAFGYGIAMIAMRKISQTDKSASTVFYFTTAGAIIALVSVQAEWVTPTPVDLAILLAVGLLGGVAQILMTEAFRLAPPSVISPFDYTAMIWAVSLGFLIFGTVPGLHVLLGSGLICVSGLFIIHREKVRGVKRGRIKGSSL